MVEERRRRRWVLPVLLLAGASTVIALRARTRTADEGSAGQAHVLPAAGLAVSRASAVDQDVPATRAVDAAPTSDPGSEPFGPGSARPRPDGSAPDPEFRIKGNAQSKLFHPPTSPYFGRTRAEVWFRTAEDAEAAGFRAYRSRSRS